MARANMRGRLQGRKRAREYEDLDSPQEDVPPTVTPFEMARIGRHIRHCGRRPHAEHNFVDLNNATARAPIEAYYDDLYARMNLKGRAPRARTITFEDLQPAAWRKQRTKGEWQEQQAERLKAAGVMDISLFPQLLEGMPHNAMQRIAAARGRAALADIAHEQAEHIMRAYAIGQSYLDKPEEVGHFLGWFFASLPPHLSSSAAGVDLLNKFIRLDPALCFATFAAVPQLAGALLDRHTDERQHNQPLDMTDKLNFRALRFFTLIHMREGARPKSARRLAMMPPPQMCAPGPEANNVQDRVSNMAHRAFSRLPAAWHEAEAKRLQPLQRSDRRSRTRIHPLQGDIPQRIDETRQAVASASAVLAVTVRHPSISEAPDDEPPPEPEYIPTPSPLARHNEKWGEEPPPPHVEFASRPKSKVKRRPRRSPV